MHNYGKSGKRNMKVKKTKTKRNKSEKIVKTLQENDDGDLYIEFTEEELDTFGLEKGDSVEWMELKDGEVWKKVSKNKWCI